MTARPVEAKRPLYVRALRLRHVQPGGVLCFLLFEGMVALAVLLSLAELVTWWSVLLLPVSVAVLVKINDVVAGSFRSDATRRIPLRRKPAARGVAHVVPARREGESSSDTDAPTEVFAAIPATGFAGRVARRRATNQRRFAPASTGRSPDSSN